MASYWCHKTKGSTFSVSFFIYLGFLFFWNCEDNYISFWIFWCNSDTGPQAHETTQLHNLFKLKVLHLLALNIHLLTITKRTHNVIQIWSCICMCLVLKVRSYIRSKTFDKAYVLALLSDLRNQTKARSYDNPVDLSAIITAMSDLLSSQVGCYNLVFEWSNNFGRKLMLERPMGHVWYTCNWRN